MALTALDMVQIIKAVENNFQYQIDEIDETIHALIKNNDLLNKEYRDLREDHEKLKIVVKEFMMTQNDVFTEFLKNHGVKHTKQGIIDL